MDAAVPRLALPAPAEHWAGEAAPVDAPGSEVGERLRWLAALEVHLHHDRLQLASESPVDVRAQRAGAGDDYRPVPAVRPDGGPGDARAAFVAGYRAAGGPPELEAHMIDNVIANCEWLQYWPAPWLDTGNGYLSVAQFHPQSWADAGGGDPTDFWTTGRNVATWIQAIEHPGGTGGWPTCWWR